MRTIETRYGKVDRKLAQAIKELSEEQRGRILWEVMFQRDPHTACEILWESTTGGRA